MTSSQLLHKSIGAIKATLIFKTLSQALGLTASILIVRALSEAEYGIYNLLYTTIALIYMIASLGINNTLQRFIPEYYQRGEYSLAHNLYRMLTCFRLMTNILILGLILILWEQISPLLKLAAYKPYFMLFTVIIFLDMQRNMLDICLNSFFLQKYSKAIGCLFSGTRVIGYSLIIFLEKNLWYAIVTDVSAYFIVFTCLQALYCKKVPAKGGRHSSFLPREKKRIATYAFFYNFNDAGDGLLNSYFDNLIIAVVMSPAAVGAYSFCVTIVVLVGNLLPLRYFKEIIQALFFSVALSRKKNRTQFLFQSLIKVNLIFALPVFCFLMLFSRDIILIFFNGKFVDYAMVLCTIFFFFEVLSVPTALVAQLQEKAKIIFYSKIFALYNLLADIILIQWIGIWGAALATGTAVLGKNLFIWNFVRTDATLKGMGNFFTKLILFWGIASLVIGGLNRLSPDPMRHFLLGGGLFTLLFFLQFQCRLFNSDEQMLATRAVEQVPRLALVTKWMKL